MLGKRGHICVRALEAEEEEHGGSATGRRAEHRGPPYRRQARAAVFSLRSPPPPPPPAPLSTSRARNARAAVSGTRKRAANGLHFFPRDIRKIIEIVPDTGRGEGGGGEGGGMKEEVARHAAGPTSAYSLDPAARISRGSATFAAAAAA